MKIGVLQLLEGAKKARGLAVVIDVFRAFTFEPYAFACGVKEIVPVATPREALDWRVRYPDCVLAGEDEGAQLPGFDFGNAPSQLEGVCLEGKTLVHRSSAGIQGIAAASQADEILTGSFVNAQAVVRYILARKPSEVSLVCMGWMGCGEAEEDTLCAEYLRSCLLGEPMAIREKLAQLQYTAGAKFFDENQQAVFPKGDFALCTALDAFDFVLRAERTEDGIRIRRVE